MNEITFASRAPVDGYGPRGFRIGGEWREGALLLLPAGVEPMPGGALGEEAIAPVVAAAGIGVEIMSTPSACRTFNVLLAEGRRVAAILVPV